MENLPRRLARLSTTAVAELLAGSVAPCAIVPIGAIEAHGAHAPLGADNFIAEAVAEQFALACDGVLCPTIPAGVLNVGYEFDHMPGSISMTARTLLDFISGYGSELGRNGFDPIVFVNAHGPNSHPLAIAAFEIHRSTGAQVGVLEWWSAARDVIEQIKGFAYANHGDQIETSLMLASAGADAVDLDRAEVKEVRLEALDEAERSVYLRKLTFTHRFDQRWVGETGNMGDPTRATAEAGQRIIAATVDVGLELVEALRSQAERHR